MYIDIHGKVGKQSYVDLVKCQSIIFDVSLLVVIETATCCNTVGGVLMKFHNRKVMLKI